MRRVKRIESAKRRIAYALVMVNYWRARMLNWEQELREIEADWEREKIKLYGKKHRRLDREGDKAREFARRLGRDDPSNDT